MASLSLSTFAGIDHARRAFYGSQHISTVSLSKQAGYQGGYVQRHDSLGKIIIEQPLSVSHILPERRGLRVGNQEKRYQWMMEQAEGLENVSFQTRKYHLQTFSQTFQLAIQRRQARLINKRNVERSTSGRNHQNHTSSGSQQNLGL